VSRHPLLLQSREATLRGAFSALSEVLGPDFARVLPTGGGDNPTSVGGVIARRLCLVLEGGGTNENRRGFHRRHGSVAVCEVRQAVE